MIGLPLQFDITIKVMNVIAEVFPVSTSSMSTVQERRGFIWDAVVS